MTNLIYQIIKVTLMLLNIFLKFIMEIYKLNYLEFFQLFEVLLDLFNLKIK